MDVGTERPEARNHNIALRNAELKAVKVLISSSKSYQHDVNTAVGETGADGYIVKPFNIAEFEGRVDAMLAEG